MDVALERNLRAEIATLKEERDILNEQIIQLREMLAPKIWAPPLELNLSQREAIILSCLYTAHDFITTFKLIDTICTMHLDVESSHYKAIHGPYL